MPDTGNDRLFACQVRVFDELLRDGGRAFAEGKARQIFPAGCRHASDVNALVLIKPLVGK